MEVITTDVFNKDNIQVVKGLLDESNVTKTIYVKLLFNRICIKINFYGYLDKCIPKTRFFTIFSILLYLLTITFPAYMGSIVSYEWLPNLSLTFSNLWRHKIPINFQFCICEHRISQKCISCNSLSTENIFFHCYYLI